MKRERSLDTALALRSLSSRPVSSINFMVSFLFLWSFGVFYDWCFPFPFPLCPLEVATGKEDTRREQDVA